MKHPDRRFLLWFVLAVSAIINLLAGCGQKNDLYLPDKPETEKQST